MKENLILIRHFIESFVKITSYIRLINTTPRMNARGNEYGKKIFHLKCRFLSLLPPPSTKRKFLFYELNDVLSNGYLCKQA